MTCIHEVFCTCQRTSTTGSRSTRATGPRFSCRAPIAPTHGGRCPARRVQVTTGTKKPAACRGRGSGSLSQPSRHMTAPTVPDNRLFSPPATTASPRRSPAAIRNRSHMLGRAGLENPVAMSFPLTEPGEQTHRLPRLKRENARSALLFTRIEKEFLGTRPAVYLPGQTAGTADCQSGSPACPTTCKTRRTRRYAD